MRNRILSIALALSMLAMAFVALPTSAAIVYTGSVTTTDSTGAPKTIFVEGEPVFVNVELRQNGVLIDDDINVRLYDGWGNLDGQFSDRTNDPVIGWFNSSQATPVPKALYPHLAGWEPDVMVFDIIVRVNGIWGWQEYVSTQITVLKEGLRLDPQLTTYYPGQSVEITLVTTHTQDFYLQVVNATGVTKFNLTDQEVGSDYYWSYLWTIDTLMPDGHYTMNVRDEDSHAIWYSAAFWIQKYTLSVYSDKRCVLPGDTVHLTYLITDVATLQTYYGPTIEYRAHYWNVSGNETYVSGTLPSGAGEYDYAYPADIALWSDLDMIFWANETDRSDETTLWFYTSILSADVWTDAREYVPGDTVTVTVEALATYVWGSDAVAGAEVEVTVSRNGTEIDAYRTTGLVTGIDGRATYAFTLISNAPTDVYIVNATVTKLGFTVSRLCTFSVMDGRELIVEFDRNYYVCGETATLSFRSLLNHNEVTASISYAVHTDLGLLTTGSTNGPPVSVEIPSTYFGMIWVDAQAYIGGIPVSGYDSAEVYVARLALKPAKTEYRPGDTIVWNWQVLTGLQNAMLTYVIEDEDDVTVASGSPAFAAAGSIRFEVPLDASQVSRSYTATLRLTSEIGGYVEASSSAWLVAAHELRIWIEPSKYASGEYKPGSKITVHYQINSYGTEPLPVYMIEFEFGYDPSSVVVLTTSPSGSIEYTLPDDIPAGWMEIGAVAYDGITGTTLSNDYALIALNPQLSSWDRNIGGMSAIEFTLLVLIVLMILLLIIVPFLRGRMGAPKAPKAAEPVQQTPPPPPPPPST